MVSKNCWSLTVFTLIALAALAMGLEELDLKNNQRDVNFHSSPTDSTRALSANLSAIVAFSIQRPKPLLAEDAPPYPSHLLIHTLAPSPTAVSLSPRHADAAISDNAHDDDRIQIVDTQDLTTSLQSVIVDTQLPVATGSTVHTGGIGAPPSSTAPVSTTIAPGTAGKSSVPSGGNVVPDTPATTGAGGSAAASDSDSASASASAGPSQSHSQGAAAAGNAISGAGGLLLGAVGVGVGWLL